MKRYTKMRKLAVGGYTDDPYLAVIGSDTLQQPGSTMSTGLISKTPTLATSSVTSLSKPKSGMGSNGAGIVGGVAALGTGLMDAIDSPNQYGNQSSGVTIGKGALTGAATGATIGSAVPGIGTAIGAAAGAIIGGVAGVINAKKIRRKERQLYAQQNDARKKYDAAVSSALAADKGLVEGYQGADYYAMGGSLEDPTKKKSIPIAELPIDNRRLRTIDSLATAWGVPTNSILTTAHYNYGEGKFNGAIPRRMDYIHTNPNGTYRNFYDYYDDITRGTTSLVKRAMGGPIDGPGKLNIDSTLKANAKVPFVDRILRPGNYPVRKNKDGSISTHLMATASDDKGAFAYPTLRLVNGKWVENTDPKDAITQGDIIRFKSDADAEYFSKNYKSASKLSTYGNGGPVIKPENRGKFTNWAKSHGMSVGEATSHVLSHKDEYSTEVKKMAQFSRNFGGHAMGGLIEPINEDPNKGKQQVANYKSLYGPIKDKFDIGRLRRAAEIGGHEERGNLLQNILWEPDPDIAEYISVQNPFTHKTMTRNIPPMDPILKEMQTKLLGLSQEELEKAVGKDYTVGDFIKGNFPGGISRGDALRYYKHLKSLSQKGYTLKNGGQLTRPGSILSQPTQGGDIKQLNSNGGEVEGPSHSNGGVDIASLQANVEGGETIAGNFVFSKELGFAKLHRPIAKAIGKIEKKPMTPDRLNAIALLKDREEKLALAQESFKTQNGIQ